ncbi:class I SAM-dependent methyltransferase [Pseudomonas donghuensis]|uniref:class I SAM-dependent methyltransferase n=1 Tax=Pseudomonas donghuensis TaxID=1163398 RepID=UPI0026B6F298
MAQNIYDNPDFFHGYSQLGRSRADLDTLELPKAAFDLAYSSLTLHYIDDLPRLFANVHAALRPMA